MALILHLETATKVCSVALSENGILLGCVETNHDGFAHGEKLTLYIIQVLEEHKRTMKELKAVCIASGPGSYTGLRIGVSTAKGICYALNIPLIAIDALYSLVLGAQQKYPNRTICAMIDARRMEVYSLIQFDEKILKAITADVLDENSYLDFQDLVLVGDAVEKVKVIFGSRDYIFDSELISSAKFQASMAFHKFENQDFENLVYFEPFYLKDFVAGAKKLE